MMGVGEINVTERHALVGHLEANWITGVTVLFQTSLSSGSFFITTTTERVGP